MFIRKRKNPSGSISIQIIDKSNGKYKVVETIACVKDKKELEFYIAKAESRLKQLNPNLFDAVEFNEKKHRFIGIKNKEISVVAKIGLNRTTMQELDRTQKRSLTGQ